MKSNDKIIFEKTERTFRDIMLNLDEQHDVFLENVDGFGSLAKALDTRRKRKMNQPNPNDSRIEMDLTKILPKIAFQRFKSEVKNITSDFIKNHKDSKGMYIIWKGSENEDPETTLRSLEGLDVGVMENSAFYRIPSMKNVMNIAKKKRVRNDIIMDYIFHFVDNSSGGNAKMEYDADLIYIYFNDRDFDPDSIDDDYQPDYDKISSNW